MAECTDLIRKAREAPCERQALSMRALRIRPYSLGREIEMKTTVHYVLFVSCLVFLVASCSKSPQDKIVGEWRGTDDTGETASFVFDADNNAKMVQGNFVLDGQTIGGNVTWRLDATNQDSMYLDLVVTLPSGENQTLPMIVRFITDSKIQLRKSENMGSRPTEFSDSDNNNQIVLIKQ